MRLTGILLACVLTFLCAFTGCTAVKDLDDLSALQISALQESSARLDVYDQRLMQLDKLCAQGNIRAASYHRQADQLTSLIADECQFQNAVLIKDPKIKVLAKQLLDNIQKAFVASPVIIAKIGIVVLEGLAGAHGTITP